GSALTPWGAARRASERGLLLDDRLDVREAEVEADRCRRLGVDLDVEALNDGVGGRQIGAQPALEIGIGNIGRKRLFVRAETVEALAVTVSVWFREVDLHAVRQRAADRETEAHDTVSSRVVGFSGRVLGSLQVQVH